ncbi:zinc finger dihydrouridine synthase [Lentinula aciculospora]|uniref:tRNA-dihydrouridine(47) synthase [NAD(P)(+)] n=1 Tax=Lentinula aciculospora TaxID=153920 RepID=A0A9W9DGL2_9AGAR|nr:zinc finger dihydrouridine synthase [Lentinula aciculospora]
MSVFPAGTAPVKAEYLISVDPLPVPDDDAAEGGGGGQISRHGRDAADTDVNNGGGRSKKERSKEEKKARQGQNKNRRFGKVRDEQDICFKIAAGILCEFGAECKYNHDLQTYLAAKPADLRMPTVDEVLKGGLEGVNTQPTQCPIFEEFGECKYGFKCRYLSAHIRKAPSDDGTETLSLIVDEQKKAHATISAKEVNYIGSETQKLLRTKKYPFTITDSYLRELQEADKREQELEKERKRLKEEREKAAEEGNAVVLFEPEQMQEVMAKDGAAKIQERTAMDVSSAPQADISTPDVPIRFSEKNRLDWKGKSYLAPLTTVGNLPFRRLCISYGVDITCGEMGLATSFLSGSKEEWSLVRRHPSERTFGVQIAGNKPNTLVPTAEVLAKECGSQGGIDFVDVNCGCPIDLVFKTGSGSARIVESLADIYLPPTVLDAPGKLGKAIIGMNKVLGSIPVTIKLRTGVKDGRNTAEKLMTRAVGGSGENGWGVGCITLHGRTRQQRYTKLADWEYIRQCVDAVRAREADEDLPPVPIFGNGDCFSSHDYHSTVEQYHVDGVMVGRGALIKPWIFTEIKEHREWDISSRERLEGIKKLAEFGLSHFGSDTSGINTTRRYLCEALSFQYRYLPIGLLEVLPARINDRAPSFRGRDELENLLASPDSADWVKISEMFLGPAPEAFVFVPKHKSNAYESQG